jgi:hypothetical protein
MRRTTAFIAASFVIVLAAAPADAGRPCRRMCRALIKENVVEHCAPYSGPIKRLCRKDVRSTIINYCKRQTGAGCLGD